MAYTRRRTTRYASRSGRTGRTSNRSRSTRRAPARRGRRVSARPQTVRVVIQTVAASPVSGQTSTLPMRAMF